MEAAAAITASSFSELSSFLDLQDEQSDPTV
jgi:hypothetical protein